MGARLQPFATLPLWFCAILLACACDVDRTWLVAVPADAAAEPEWSQPAVAEGNPIASWPLIHPGVEARQFSSFDRAGGNEDGFRRVYSALYVEGEEQVIFDARGPGRLNALWFTSGGGGYDPLALGRLRFYFDDEQVASVDEDSDELFTGTRPGFPLELVFRSSRSTGGFVSFVPMTFARRLKITTSERPYFYNAQYDSFPADTELTSWSSAAPPSPLEETFRRVLANTALEEDATGEEQSVPLEYEQRGAGTIESLRILVAPDSPTDLHAAHIQIYWDEQAEPAVDCPLDMFFGSGLGWATVRALPFSMKPDERELSSRFLMPFWRGFRILISGIDGELRLRVGPQRYRERHAGYLHAAYARENPPLAGEDFQYLARAGAGTLVGTVLTVTPANAATDKGWWEGDLRSYANGRRTPSIHGTGHEDDHLGGWSNRFFSRPFSLPMNGEPVATILDFNGQYNGNVSMYRLWTGIPFLSELRHSVEHGRANERGADYQATSFFYATADDWLRETDVLQVCDIESRQRHAFVAEGESGTTVSSSAFEGRAYRVSVAGCQQSHAGAAQFELEVAPDNVGVYLRRLYDQSQPQQSARLSVDGQEVGEWYVAEGNTVARWAERDFFLPSKVTRGKSRLMVRLVPGGSPLLDPAGGSPLLDPAGGSPLWNAAEYRALSVLSP
jgi:hypothetical protein